MEVRFEAVPSSSEALLCLWLLGNCTVEAGSSQASGAAVQRSFCSWEKPCSPARCETAHPSCLGTPGLLSPPPSGMPRGMEKGFSACSPVLLSQLEGPQALTQIEAPPPPLLGSCTNLVAPPWCMFLNFYLSTLAVLH